MSDKSLSIYTDLPAKTLFGSDESTGNLKEILEKIREAVLAEPVDVSTPQGRKACASLAYKVARSKTALDEAGKRQTETARAYIARINDERKYASTFLDNLRDEVRKPLNEFEAREKERVDALKAGVARIESIMAQIAALPDDSTAFAHLDQLLLGPVLAGYHETDWAEFSAHAELAYLRVKNAIDAKKEAVKRAVEEKIKAEREERLAREQAAKEQQEREEKLRREERARVEAEAAAKIEKERAEKIAAEQNAVRIEAQRLADLQRAKEEQERAVHEAAAKARQDAERKAAQEKSEREAQEKAAQEAERRRQANREHRASVNNKAVHDLKQEAGLTEEQARAVLVAIVSGRIRNVSVNY